MSKTAAVPVFELGATGENFKSKSKDVFGVLQTLEDKHEAVESARRKSGSGKDDESFWKNDPFVEPDLVSRNRRQQGRGGRPRGRYSSRPSDRGDDFKKPYFRAPKRFNKHSIPDYKKHPEKYTCYSLHDVTSDDMSDASNTRAAFDFLEERRKFREQQEGVSEEEVVKVDIGDTACSKGAFTFKKRSKTDSQLETKSDKTKEKTLVRLGHEDDNEGVEDLDSGSVEGTVSFKSRKSKRRNIRSREDAEDEED